MRLEIWVTQKLNWPRVGTAVSRMFMELWVSIIFAIVRRVDSGTVQSCRGSVGWSQQVLAKQARVGIVTVHQLEAGLSHPRNATLEVIRHAFEAAGVQFIDENGGGPGVRLRERRRK